MLLGQGVKPDADGCDAAPRWPLTPNSVALQYDACLRGQPGMDRPRPAASGRAASCRVRRRSSWCSTLVLLPP